MVVPLLLAVFALSTGQFGQPGGIPNPALVHQRFRGNETLFAGQDFFQWWFFWLRGADGQHFTMHYSLSRVPTENGGGFLGFSFVSEGTNEKGFRADRFLEGMQVAGYCNVSLGGHSNFLAVDDNTYLLTGSMRGKDQQFHATPNLQGVDVSWNVTVRRVHGWYGENGLVSDSFIQQFNSYFTHRKGGHTCRHVRQGNDQLVAVRTLVAGLRTRHCGQRDV